MKTTLYLRIGIVAATTALLYGCSEQKSGSQSANPVFVYVHPQGFASPASTDFHGNAIRNSGWDIRQCRQCHGGTYTGSNAISCINSGCHVDYDGNPKSPESCNTCHGTFTGHANDTLSWAPPRSATGDLNTTARGVGAHQFHLNPAMMDLSNAISCNVCHRVPSDVYVSGHFDSPTAAQTMYFGQPAKTPSAGITPNPSYDSQSLRCSNTYCHGNFAVRKSTSTYQFVYTDSVIAGARYSPQWNGGEQEDACGTCHGIPPAGHRNFGTSVTVCTTCHYYKQSGQGQQLDKSIHINGRIDLYGQEYDFGQ
ncbi:MAG TPA: CxxxxCH/CxxCH domain-containing protein [Bacteroidota bacterium]